MVKLEKQHIDFVTQCALSPNKTHESDLPPAELDQISREGLLIRYGGVKIRYAISKYGSQYVKELTSQGEIVHPEMRELAVKFVVSKGYDKQAAEQIVTDNGVEAILQSQADELRQGTQREVKVPMNAQGKPEIKFKGA